MSVGEGPAKLVSLVKIGSALVTADTDHCVEEDMLDFRDARKTQAEVVDLRGHGVAQAVVI